MVIVSKFYMIEKWKKGFYREKVAASSKVGSV
jgi:hypothetical protein